MEFEGCLNSDEKSLCEHLLRSLASFEPFPHEKKIRLALTPPIPVSLNVTVQHGPCAISCEGGNLNSCNTTKENHFWPDVSYPFYIENCTPSHNYCVTATIGDCCPICTATVFMPDSQQGYYYEDVWNTELIIIVVLILTLFALSFVAVLKNYFNNRLKVRRQESQNVSDPLTYSILEIDNQQPRIHVVCLYLRENNSLFIHTVNSVQEFLRRKGFNVIDIYDEEENINQSVTKWVKSVIREQKTKILLFDTVNTRQLWNGATDSNKILKPLEQVFLATRSCIPITSVHNYLFVIRFQGMDFDDKAVIDLNDGRCYVYPIHRERLANDLKC